MLKALELIGFKSFADKTRLDFHAGVTCVVGPNGSGKSNVVDAIKWVTGSQSAKAMRGKEMTDVIFNGASERKAMNSAEVTLEFDNTAGLFELEAPTVRFTRRVYRSGEGEYLINGSPTRLRDIRALLAGTGIGAESYSVIEQGRVDALLRASPKDRRAIFEEAAGVSRFRLKKHEAAKRLARVEQNLLRLSDIVDEVEGRLRRVKKQAGKAQRYRESAQRLQQLRTQLALVDWQALDQKAERIERRTSALAAEQQQGQTTLSHAEEELDRLESAEQQAASQLATVDKQAADLREQIGAARAKIETDYLRIAELHAELQQRRSRLKGALASGPQGADEGVGLKEQLAAAEADRSRTAQRLETAERAVSTLDQQLAELTEQSEELERASQAEQDEYNEIKRREEQSASVLNTHTAEQQTSRKRRSVVEAELERLQRDVETSRARQAAAAAELDAVSQQLGELQSQTAQQRKELDDCRKRLADGESTVARLRTLIEAAEVLDSDLREVRSRLPDESSRAWRVEGVLADLLHVDFDSAPMVEAALGPRARHLVLDSGQMLLADLAAGSASPAARVSLQRLDFQATASVVDRIDLSGEPGVMGRADQFVECEPRYEPLVRRLLGRVWFVDTLETAERLANGVGKGLSFITYQGESLTADGVLTVGQRKSSQSLFQRRAQLDEHKTELATATRAIDSLREQAARLEQAINSQESACQRGLERRNEATDAHAETRHRTRRLEEKCAELNAERESLQAADTHADEKLAALREETQSLRQQIERLEESRQATTQKREQLAADRQAVASRLQPLQAALIEQQVAAAKAEQRVEVLTSQWRQARNSNTEQSRLREEAAADITECLGRIAATELRLLGLRAELDGLHLDHERVHRERRSLQTSAETARGRRNQIAVAVKKRRVEVDQLGAERQRLAIQLAEVRHEQTAVGDRMRDDYSIDLSKISAAHDAEAVGDREAVEREIAELREDVHSVGAVNLESIEELDDLESRFNELSSQYKDLSDAKNALERLLQRLNIETRKLFLTTIESVRGEFRELFRQLFGGGEADLALVDGDDDDPLDAGVEIRAQPPGKELSNITLLSGGEKTLTCVALLLALFRTKPSPFCVLDEVDAALDEANIDRFTNVLSEFLSSTQFIVITHSKKTMTDADTIYGITMQESGVSKQVAVRFEEVDEQGFIRPPVDPPAAHRQAA